MMLPNSGQKPSDHPLSSYPAYASIIGSASHSNVANPYQAAKIRYLLELQAQ